MRPFFVYRRRLSFVCLLVVFRRFLRSNVYRQIIRRSFGNARQADYCVNANLRAFRSILKAASENDRCLDEVVMRTMRPGSVNGRSSSVLASIVRASRREEGVHDSHFDDRWDLADKRGRYTVNASTLPQGILSNFCTVNGTQCLRRGVQVRNYRFLAFPSRSFMVDHGRFNASVALCSVTCLRMVSSLVFSAFGTFFHRREEINNCSIRGSRVVYFPSLVRIDYVGGRFRAC